MKSICPIGHSIRLLSCRRLWIIVNCRTMSSFFQSLSPFVLYSVAGAFQFVFFFLPLPYLSSDVPLIARVHVITPSHAFFPFVNPSLRPSHFRFLFIFLPCSASFSSCFYFSLLLLLFRSARHLEATQSLVTSPIVRCKLICHLTRFLSWTLRYHRRTLTYPLN